MSKERKTVTLDPEVAAYLNTEGRNASETVNKLVKLDMGEDVVNEQLIKMRMEMEQDRYESAAQKARGHLERYNQLKRRLDQRKDHQQSVIQDAKEALDGARLNTDNPAVKNWAEKANISPEELIEEVENEC